MKVNWAGIETSIWILREGFAPIWMHYWKLFPRLFPLIFKLRMRRVAEEDNRMIYDRAKDSFYSDVKFATVIPEKFDFFEGKFIKDFSSFNFSFYDHYFRPKESSTKDGK